MTTTEQSSTALATREFSEKQIRQRMELNAQARFGLQDATPAQLNIIYMVARRWALDPINELTLFEGRPFITLDGRLQLARRNPDYRGYKTRPLSRQEKEDWGYEPDDVVVECTVLTHTHGEITERGCVRRGEIDGARARSKDSGKRAAPVGIYGPEIAEARAIKRATRAAFGQDIPDEDDISMVIEERDSPERQKALVDIYDRITPTEQEMDTASDAGKTVYCSIDGCQKVVSPKLQKESVEKFAAVYCRAHFDEALADATPDTEQVEA
jgi:hypothetical protein